MGRPVVTCISACSVTALITHNKDVQDSRRDLESSRLQQLCPEWTLRVKTEQGINRDGGGEGNVMLCCVMNMVRSSLTCAVGVWFNIS